MKGALASPREQVAEMRRRVAGCCDAHLSSQSFVEYLSSMPGSWINLVKTTDRWDAGNADRLGRSSKLCGLPGAGFAAWLRQVSR